MKVSLEKKVRWCDMLLTPIIFFRFVYHAMYWHHEILQRNHCITGVEARENKTKQLHDAAWR